MTQYNYKERNEEINNILKNEITIEEKEMIPSYDSFTFNKGYEVCVTAVFVDIRDSSNLIFNNENQQEAFKIINSFTSEVIEIMYSNKNYYDIGIRGDCVYGIYSTPLPKDTYDAVDVAFHINTFIKMLNKKLKLNKLKTISVGIGVATSKTIVLKSGRKFKNINDNIWFGESVSLASHFSNLANKNYDKPIIVSDITYNIIIEQLCSKNSEAETWFSWRKHNGNEFYTCNIINTEFNEWIESNL